MSAPRVHFVEGEGPPPRGVMPVLAVLGDSLEPVGGAPLVPLQASGEPPVRQGHHWVMWRLLSGNNRELGRSPKAFESLDDALESLVQLRSGLRRAEHRIVQDLSPTEWSWVLLADNEAHARSSRTYQRLRECHYSLTAFIDGLPIAQVQAHPSQVLRQRRLHAAAVAPRPTPIVEVR